MKDLTVLIPNYKHENVLQDAVDSVKHQAYVSIIDDYPRMGKGFRMNTVVPFIQSEWLNIHDADDISSTKRFEICSEYFDDYDVIYHDVYIRNECGWSVAKSREWNRELYKKLSYICASSVIVRTEIAQRVKWIANTYGQDWIWLNLIAQHTDRFKYISEPLLYYRGELGFTKKLLLKSVRRYFLRKKIARLTR